MKEKIKESGAMLLIICVVALSSCTGPIGSAERATQKDSTNSAVKGYIPPRYGFTENDIYLLAQLLCGDKGIHHEQIIKR